MPEARFSDPPLVCFTDSSTYSPAWSRASVEMTASPSTEPAIVSLTKMFVPFLCIWNVRVPVAFTKKSAAAVIWYMPPTGALSRERSNALLCRFFVSKSSTSN